MNLEQRCFTTPWSGQTYYNELVHNQLSFYWVLRPYPAGVEGVPPILAYGGYWLTGDEAHIVTIATHPDYRRQRLGRLLMEQMIKRAHMGGAYDITLEVRAGNLAAQETVQETGICDRGVAQEVLPGQRRRCRADDALSAARRGVARRRLTSC